MRHARDGGTIVNSSLWLADLTTHAKILVVSILATSIVVAVGIAAQKIATSVRVETAAFATVDGRHA